MNHKPISIIQSLVIHLYFLQNLLRSTRSNCTLLVCISKYFLKATYEAVPWIRVSSSVSCRIGYANCIREMRYTQLRRIDRVNHFIAWHLHLILSWRKMYVRRLENSWSPHWIKLREAWNVNFASCHYITCVSFAEIYWNKELQNY